MSMKNILLSAISFLTISTAVNATGEIKIVNQNPKELDVRFEASDDSKIYFDHKIPATEESKFTLSADQLKGKKIFWVKGSSNGFTSDKCKDLHVDKDYELVFTNDSVGTTCVATEVTEDMKSKNSDSMNASDHNMEMDKKVDSTMTPKMDKKAGKM